MSEKPAADALREQVQRSLLEFIAAAVMHNTAVSARVGLGASDAQFLSLLSVHGPLTAGRLAQLTGLTTGTVTGVIDRLQQAGYVTRERDARDRRKVVVTPVPAAMAALAEHYSDHGDHVRTLLEDRPAEQLAVIADFLTDLTGSPGGWISPAPGAPTPGPADRRRPG